MKEIKVLENSQFKYYVTEEGKVYVKRKSNGKLKEKFVKLKGGYPTVTVCMEGKHFQHSIHRLVAQAFIPNPHNKPQVNHIDGNKENPHVSNLEWVTPKENVRHAIDILKVGVRVSAYIICKIRKEVIEVTDTYTGAVEKYGTWVIDSFRGLNSYGNLIAVSEEEYLQSNSFDELFKKREPKRLYNVRTKYRKYNQDFVDELKEKFNSTSLNFTDFCKQVGLDPRTVKTMLNGEYFKDSKYHQKKRRTAKCFYSGVVRVDFSRYNIK